MHQLGISASGLTEQVKPLRQINNALECISTARGKQL